MKLLAIAIIVGPPLWMLAYIAAEIADEMRSRRLARKRQRIGSREATP